MTTNPHCPRRCGRGAFGARLVGALVLVCFGFSVSVGAVPQKRPKPATGRLPSSTVVRAGPMGLAGAATMGLGVGLLAAGAALFAVQENPELRDDIRPFAQAITGVVATLSAATLLALGAVMLGVDVLWLSADEEPADAGAADESPPESTVH